MDRSFAKETAQRAAHDLKRRLGIEALPELAYVLGTGWGDLLQIEDERKVPMRELTGFENLGELEGHKRQVCYGTIGGRPVIALRGRVHLNERLYDAAGAHAVRLQVEMLLELGVRTVVVTNAAGALGDRARVGDVVAADGFVTVYAPDLPYYAGEFVPCELALDGRLRALAREAAPKGLAVREGGYVMLRGPFFEGTAYDKQILYATGATCVGMSSVPEAIAVAGYHAQGARALVLSYVTNDDREEHSHETNLARAKADAPKLGGLLVSLAKQA